MLFFEDSPDLKSEDNFRPCESLFLVHKFCQLDDIDNTDFGDFIPGTCGSPAFMSYCFLVGISFRVLKIF